MWLRRDVRCAAAHPVCALSVTQDIDGHRQTGDDMTRRKRTTADSTGAERKWRTVTSIENTRDAYPNLSLPQVADRNAIRELVDAYAAVPIGATRPPNGVVHARVLAAGCAPHSGTVKRLPRHNGQPSAPVA
jgi:hypothetical protein